MHASSATGGRGLTLVCRACPPALVEQETDRVYKTGANEVAVLESGKESVKVEYTCSTVAKDGSDEPLPYPDCVLWNPWVDKVRKGDCNLLGNWARGPSSPDGLGFRPTNHVAVPPYPRQSQSKAMGDFGDDEFREMVCVEPGIVSAFHQLPPGHAFVLEQTIRPCPAPGGAAHIGELKSEL